MEKHKIEEMKKTSEELGYTYTSELIDKIYNAYLVETNEDTKDLLEELLDYIYNY